MSKSADLIAADESLFDIAAKAIGQLAAVAAQWANRPEYERTQVGEQLWELACTASQILQPDEGT